MTPAISSGRHPGCCCFWDPRQIRHLHIFSNVITANWSIWYSCHVIQVVQVIRYSNQVIHYSSQRCHLGSQVKDEKRLCFFLVMIERNIVKTVIDKNLNWSDQTWCQSLTKFSALQLRKAEGKAGHQATQFIGALVVVAMIVMWWWRWWWWSWL